MTTTTGELRVCPNDQEPVVFTMEFPGAEYVCVVCGWKGGVLGVPVMPATSERVERHGHLIDLYEAQRAERQGRRAPAPPPQDVPRPTCKGCGQVAEGRLDHSGKPAHWYSRTVKDVTEFACSRGCINDGMVAPW